MKFQPITPDSALEAISFGEGSNGRVLIFRLPNSPDVWDGVPDTRVVVQGGARAKAELAKLFDSSKKGLTRRALSEALPGGINSRTHTVMRQWLGL